ncbi:hypothetical protein CP533_0218 [Ophiocordyceps camponoti-saundersi (nom. inval.)]|nr:hypothetical protein CP533_0218 [Ophiocordyceps camponoti-saundersi (nom. inval.)]
MSHDKPVNDDSATNFNSPLDNVDAVSAATMTSQGSIPQTLWNARIPVLIRHEACPEGMPLITSIPRFSYLALLRTRLSVFFRRPCSSFHFEDVQLRNLAVGLLLDLYRPSLPWRLTVSDGVSWDIADTFLNCADFIRNGNANQIMKMSKDHTTQLWHAVIDNDYASYALVHTRLLNAPTTLKHIPLKIYIPSPPQEPDSDIVLDSGSFKVIQSLVPATGPDRRPTLLGQALKTTMPRLFPSSRDPILASVILHGAPAPFHAPLEELMREAAYPDGWLCLVVVVV